MQSQNFTDFVGPFVLIIISIVVISLILKGLSLWKSAQSSQKYWFIALLILNTAGILPALYLAFFQKKQTKSSKKPKKPKKT